MTAGRLGRCRGRCNCVGQVVHRVGELGEDQHLLARGCLRVSSFDKRVELGVLVGVPFAALLSTLEQGFDVAPQVSAKHRRKRPARSHLNRRLNRPAYVARRLRRPGSRNSASVLSSRSPSSSASSLVVFLVVLEQVARRRR